MFWETKIARFPFCIPKFVFQCLDALAKILTHTTTPSLKTPIYWGKWEPMQSFRRKRNNHQNSGHFVYQQRQWAAHALRRTKLYCMGKTMRRIQSYGRVRGLVVSPCGGTTARTSTPWLRYWGRPRWLPGQASDNEEAFVHFVCQSPRSLPEQAVLLGRGR